MSGGANSKRTDSTIVVPDLAALAEVWVAPLDEGSIAYVSSVNKEFVLRKASAIPADGTTVIAPAAGAPIAGSPTAKWILQVTNGGVLQSKDVKLATDQTIATPDAGAYLPIAGMSLPITTSPVGGVLAIDFSASATLLSESGDVIADFAVTVDGSQVAWASFDGDGGEGDVSAIETVGITTRHVLVAPGDHTLGVEWRLSIQEEGGGALSCTPVAVPDRFFMDLRVIELTG